MKRADTERRDWRCEEEGRMVQWREKVREKGDCRLEEQVRRVRKGERGKSVGLIPEEIKDWRKSSSSIYY